MTDSEQWYEGDNEDEPDKCSCWGLTMVGYSANQYGANRSKWGDPSGHHPMCQHYEPPPRFDWAKSITKHSMSEFGAVSPERTLAAALYDVIGFLEKQFPDAKADGKEREND